MDLFTRIFAWAIVIGIICCLLPIAFIVLTSLILYECLPHRRRLIADYERSVLAFLAHHGATSGRDLWNHANTQLTTSLSMPSFYSLMARLEQEEVVLGEETSQVIEDEGQRFQISTRCYRLLDRNWEKRKHRLSSFRNVFPPLPLRSIIYPE